MKTPQAKPEATYDELVTTFKTADSMHQRTEAARLILQQPIGQVEADVKSAALEVIVNANRKENGDPSMYAVPNIDEQLIKQAA